MRRTEHSIHFWEEYDPRPEHLIGMLRTIATTAFVVDGAVIHLHPMGSVSKTLSSPNGLQLLQRNRSANAGIIGSVEKLKFEISTTPLRG